MSQEKDKKAQEDKNREMAAALKGGKKKFILQVINNETVNVEIKADSEEEAIEIIEGWDFEDLKCECPHKVVAGRFEVLTKDDLEYIGE